MNIIWNNKLLCDNKNTYKLLLFWKKMDCALPNSNPFKNYWYESEIEDIYKQEILLDNLDNICIRIFDIIFIRIWLESFF